MPDPARLAIVYCNDEDLAIRAIGDYSVLAPNSNMLAAGVDGVIDPSDLWTLTSASNDFEAQGVASGCTVNLKSATLTGASKPSLPWGASGGLFGVSSVSGHSMTLRRLGMPTGVGLPVAPAVGFTTVQFAVETLAPQIEQASDEINRRYGIDPASSLRGPSEIYDLRELREACMLVVLVRKYTGDVRTKDGAFALKIKELTKERDDSFSRLLLRWGASPDAPVPPPPAFGMRCSR